MTALTFYPPKKAVEMRERRILRRRDRRVRDMTAAMLRADGFTFQEVSDFLGLNSHQAARLGVKRGATPATVSLNALRAVENG